MWALAAQGVQCWGGGNLAKETWHHPDLNPHQPGPPGQLVPDPLLPGLSEPPVGAITTHSPDLYSFQGHCLLVLKVTKD